MQGLPRACRSCKEANEACGGPCKGCGGPSRPRAGPRERSAGPCSAFAGPRSRCAGARSRLAGTRSRRAGACGAFAGARSRRAATRSRRAGRLQQPPGARQGLQGTRRRAPRPSPPRAPRNATPMSRSGGRPTFSSDGVAGIPVGWTASDVFVGRSPTFSSDRPPRRGGSRRPVGRPSGNLADLHRDRRGNPGRLACPATIQVWASKAERGALPRGSNGRWAAGRDPAGAGADAAAG